MTTCLSRDFVQGSREWLAWRREGIGASESAALLGKDAYGQTPRTLWLEKTKPWEPKDEAAHLIQGHEIETMLRAAHEIETGEEWPSACFEHPEFPFIHASLDGWNGSRAIECKAVTALAMGTPVPEHHFIQCQHQLLVTATDAMTYIRHNRASGKTEKIEVKEDRNIQREILAACWKFWDQVQSKTEPDYMDADWFPREDVALAVVVKDWKASKTTAERKTIRALMFQMCERPRTLCQGVKIQKAPFNERVWDTEKEKTNV